MTATELLQQAVQLPPEQRALMAVHLLGSMKAADRGDFIEGG